LLEEHPDRADILPWIKQGVSVLPYLTEHAKDLSMQEPFNKEMFTSSVYPNRIPHEHAQFVDDEVRKLIQKGCLVTWEHVRGPSGPQRPRRIQTLSVEPSKPRLV